MQVGMWSLKHVNMETLYHRGTEVKFMCSTKHINIGAPIIKVSKHMSFKEFRQVDMFWSKHVNIRAYDHQSMWT